MNPFTNAKTGPTIGSSGDNTISNITILTEKYY